MNDQKMNPNTAIAAVIVLVSVFLPAYFFDFLLPGVRATVLRYDDWEMWKFWYECLLNNHNGVQIFQAFSDLVDKAKLVLWTVTTVALPSGGLFGMLLWNKKQHSKITALQTSAVFAKLKDLKEYQGTDGLILTKNVQMKLNTCFTHLLVIGPTGSGKTQSFFLPNIMKLPPEYSAVITDPKGELFQKTAAHQRKLGRIPVLLKLDVKENSVCWNPLDVPKDSVTMAKMCTSIIKNKGGGGSGGGGGDQDFWDSTAIDLLLAMVYVVKALPKGPSGTERTYGNFKNVYEILGGCSFDAMLGLAKFAVAELGCQDVLSRIASFADSVAPEDTRNSTRFVLKTALSPFMIDDVACITSLTDFDFCDLKRKPIALYISVPEHKVAGLAPVISTLYMQIFDSLLEMGEGGRPVFFLMDEFANIGKVIGFPQYVATIRSRNLSVAVCLQSAEQLTRNYSEPEKQEILNNLKVTVVLPGLKEEKSLQYLQTIGGKIAELGKPSAQEDERVITKDRLPLHEIREMEDNYDTGVHEALVIFPNKPAYKDRQRRSYSDPEIKKLLDTCGKTEFPVRDPKMWEDIQSNCFLTAGERVLLDVVGAYINYDGAISKIPEAKKLDILAKFNEVNSICTLPTVMSIEKGAYIEAEKHFEQHGSKLVDLKQKHVVVSMTITKRETIKDAFRIMSVTRDFQGDIVEALNRLVFTANTGYASITWISRIDKNRIKVEEPDTHAKYARRIIETTFVWSIREDLMKLTKANHDQEAQDEQEGRDDQQA